MCIKLTFSKFTYLTNSILIEYLLEKDNYRIRRFICT